MSWVARVPMPRDFCGRPPCPLCFDWSEGESALSGLAKMALDLLCKPLDDATSGQRTQLNQIAKKIHAEGVGALAEPDNDSPPPAADIGMSSAQQMDGWLRERQQRPIPTDAIAPTLDAIFDRKASREAEEKRKRKEREERLREAREVAQVFADAQRGQDERQRYEEQRLLREVDPAFVDYCRSRGIVSGQEIYARWRQEAASRYMMPSYFDPTKGPIMGGRGT